MSAIDEQGGAVVPRDDLEQNVVEIVARCGAEFEAWLSGYSDRIGIESGLNLPGVRLVLTPEISLDLSPALALRLRDDLLRRLLPEYPYVNAEEGAPTDDSLGEGDER